MKIATPGVYEMLVDLYHADPVPGGSLSSSGARKLLPPGCPALFHYERTNPIEPNADFDFGHLAHKLVLGAGADIVVIDADSYHAKEAKEQRDAAYAEGKIPALKAKYARARAMASALRNHPVAAALLAPGRGKAEQALFWRDRETGIWRRALVDHLPHAGGPGRFIAVDYKTCASADPESIMRSVYNYGYHQQDDWYLDGIRAVGLDDDPAMVFIFQEKQPPFLVNTIQLTATARLIARDLNRQAIEIYAACKEAGRWPGYSAEIEPVGLPPWIENAWRNGF